MKFDPFSQWGKVFETWQKMADDSVARTNAFFAEVEKTEAKRLERVEHAIEEMAKMQKDTLAYGAQLGAEMRKLSVEAMQKVSTLASSTASN
jgi:hypothetical protein